MNATDALYEILDGLEECTISGWELQEMVSGMSGKRPYPSTLLQRAREYAEVRHSSAWTRR